LSQAFSKKSLPENFFKKSFIKNDVAFEFDFYPQTLSSVVKRRNGFIKNDETFGFETLIP
jgi:hypothetical protein